MTKNIATALPARVTRQAHYGESRSAVADSAGALRVGVIGVGEQTASHLLSTLLTLPKVRIAALVDPLREQRDALADGPELARACRDWGVPLVEDAAQAHGTSLFGRYAGTQGTIGTFSTHARKLICTGEGGFCLTGDPALADRLRQLCNLGRPSGGGEFGVGFGLNYKLPALAAALGRVQLSRLTSRLAQRSLVLGKLITMATEIAGLESFPIPHGTKPNGYAALFTAEPGLASRIAHRSRAAGIESDVLRYDYRPLYRTPVLTRYAPTQPCRNVERLAATLLTVPCHERVATDDLARIGAAWRG